MDKCKIHGILQTKHHTIHCNILLWSFSANTEVYSEYMAYCTLFCVLHTIQCTSNHMAYCTLHSTLYTAHYNIPGDLTQAKTTPHSSSLFLQTRDVQLSQKCTVFSVLIIIQYVKRRVVCSAPYSLQYSVLNTLKNFYLNNLGGEQLKKITPQNN